MSESSSVRVSKTLREYLNFLKDCGHYEDIEELLTDNLDKMSVTCDQRHKKFTETYQWFGGIMSIQEEEKRDAKEKEERLRNPLGDL